MSKGGGETLLSSHSPRYDCTKMNNSLAAAMYWGRDLGPQVWVQALLAASVGKGFSMVEALGFHPDSPRASVDLSALLASLTSALEEVLSM